MDEVAACIALCMEDGFEEKVEAIRARVEAICSKYPLVRLRTFFLERSGNGAAREESLGGFFVCFRTVVW